MKHKLENQSQIPRPQNNEIQMHLNFKTQKPHTKKTNEITLHSMLKNRKQSNKQITPYQSPKQKAKYIPQNGNRTLKRKP